MSIPCMHVLLFTQICISIYCTSSHIIYRRLVERMCNTDAVLKQESTHCVGCVVTVGERGAESDLCSIACSPWAYSH